MRQVLLDGALLEAVQTRLFTAKAPFETGLVIGRLSEQKDYVIALIPTCDSEDAPPPRPGQMSMTLSSSTTLLLYLACSPGE
mmetsp:Transcript_16803/g.38828  ORF Transcript_16803/g.38828 Transcript_16803/m.38828 type:complete len:82 (+) Transcript_16803:29-274(+)